MSNPLGDPAVPMKPLLSETVKTEFSRHVALTDDRLSRPITDASRRDIRESGARVARVISLQHSRTALASTLLRDTDCERYLTDKGARAGLTGFASAAWDDAA